MNDAGLVVEARAGNLKAFGALYDRHAGGIHDFLRSVTGDDSIAREVLHDTFVVAGSRLLQLPKPAKVRPWLFAIARHQVQRAHRRGAAEQRDALVSKEEEVSAAEPDPRRPRGARRLAERGGRGERVARRPMGRARRGEGSGTPPAGDDPALPSTG